MTFGLNPKLAHPKKKPCCKTQVSSEEHVICFGLYSEASAEVKANFMNGIKLFQEVQRHLIRTVNDPTFNEG